MQNLPLVTHTSLDKTLAWHKGVAISVQKFLTDVNYLSALLPDSQYVLNVCRDRYCFAVGVAAAIVSNKVTLLPSTHTPEMVQQLQAFSSDIFCLHDHKDYDIALPQLCYPDMPELYDSHVDIPKIDVEQLVAIVFTSGSTGTPIPHKKHWGLMVQNVQAQAERLGLSADIHYSIIGTVPPQHMYGLESTVLLPLQSGNAFSSEQPFYPVDICSTLDDVPSPRILVSTPLHLRSLLEAEVAIPELALVLSATAPLSSALAYKIEASVKAPLLEIYGSTETGQIATRSSTQHSEWHLFPGVQLSQRGERVWAEAGHVEKPVVLNDVIELVDSTHFLLHGRTHDLINIAGKRNSLASLNHHLNSIEGVVDSAFFMPHEVSHDHVTRLTACVVAPNLTASAILAALRVRIDPVFLPRPLVFVKSLPRNSTGKLPRDALQKLITEHLHQNLDGAAQSQKSIV